LPTPSFLDGEAAHRLSCFTAISQAWSDFDRGIWTPWQRKHLDGFRDDEWKEAESQDQQCSRAV